MRLPWYLAYNVPLNWTITGPDNLTGKDHRYITARWSQSWTRYFKTEATAVRVSSFDRTQRAQRTTQMAIRGVFDYALRETKHQLIAKYNYYTFDTDSQSYRAYNAGINPVTGLIAANEVKGLWRHHLHGRVSHACSSRSPAFPITARSSPSNRGMRIRWRTFGFEIQV